MELARTLEPVPTHSPLATVRIRRKLTVEEAAKRAGITADEARWLEQARVYRFRSADAALGLARTPSGLDARSFFAWSNFEVQDVA